MWRRYRYVNSNARSRFDNGNAARYSAEARIGLSAKNDSIFFKSIDLLISGCSSPLTCSVNSVDRAGFRAASADRALIPVKEKSVYSRLRLSCGASCTSFERCVQHDVAQRPEVEVRGGPGREKRSLVREEAAQSRQAVGCCAQHEVRPGHAHSSTLRSAISRVFTTLSILADSGPHDADAASSCCQRRGTCGRREACGLYLGVAALRGRRRGAIHS